jgi:hypothetical protein
MKTSQSMPQANPLRPVGDTRKSEWNFVQSEDGWIWEHITRAGGSVTVGFFPTLSECMLDAEYNGYRSHGA